MNEHAPAASNDLDRHHVSQAVDALERSRHLASVLEMAVHSIGDPDDRSALHEIVTRLEDDLRAVAAHMDEARKKPAA